jgi:hypothetical protein
MNERAIFTEALDRETPAGRAAYLDAACAGDPVLRARVEALLRSHEQAGEFPGKPAPQRLAEEFAAREPDDTRTGPGGADADGGLDFLEPPDKPGSIGRLGHYEVQEVVGRGGMGVVLKAFDEQLHRVVAIKVMAPPLAASATARKRFVREARAQAAVTQDHVVTIHAVEESGPLPYIVMQFVSGESLQDRLDRAGPLQLHEVLRIGTQAATGLAAAHAQELVHRDVKPANILLENGVERVKLTDFGLARAADDASLTQSGTVAGTPAFMSPEQAEGKPLDHRSDLFSLGSVLYAMCTGRPPFRAASSMGVLKRVCEDTPTPIRETNPEVPDWLAAVAEKLHAKDPADRFQSAAEVAALLGRHLAHVQHPSVAPLPAASSSFSPSSRGVGGKGVRRGRRRWVVAAAVLVALLAALGTTEATGVTNVRATVIRILTPEGTLVVETDDPAVKVVVEGDGDLVITGAGPQEVRLRAGSYRLKATKDGRPVKLDRDLVNITRHDRQIVRVRLEGDAPAAAVPKAETGAFVLQGGKGVAERKFDTLAEAVQRANDGDTIEVRGNGPFATEPLRIRAALTIRAGHGFRPVIRLSPEIVPGQGGWVAEAPLGLEGLELQCKPRPKGEGDPGQILLAANRGLYAANCRFLMRRLSHFILGGAWPCELYNCEILSSEGAYAIMIPNLQPGQRLVMENCLFAGLQVWQPDSHRIDKEGGRVRLTRNTFRTVEGHVWLHLIFEAVPDLKKLDESVKALRVEASGNVFDAGAVLEVGHALPPEKFPPDDVLRLLRRHYEWKGERNVYAVDGWFGRGPRPEKYWQPIAELKGLDDWRRFWGTTEAGSAEGRVRYEGGDLLARLAAEPDKLTPEDFRLRADSAGYRAGKDGKDLGADVDLVGPGAAYERWKKTPEYRQWLKDTGQLKK